MNRWFPLKDFKICGDISMHTPPTEVSHWQLKLWVSSIVPTVWHLTYYGTRYKESLFSIVPIQFPVPVPVALPCTVYKPLGLFFFMRLVFGKFWVFFTSWSSKLRIEFRGPIFYSITGQEFSEHWIFCLSVNWNWISVFGSLMNKV